MFILFVGVLLMIGLGFWFYSGSKYPQSASSSRSYFLASESLGVLLLSFSIMATQLGATMFMATVSIARASGWRAFYYPLGSAIGLLTLGVYLGKKMKKSNVATTSEIFKKSYDSTFLHKISSLSSICSLFFILVIQVIGSKKLLFAFGYSDPVICYALWAIVIGYTVLGGLRAVVVTDFFQSLFIFIVFMLVPFFIRFVPDTAVRLPPLVPLEGSFITLFIMPCLFMIIGQDMGQRCFSGKSERTVSYSFIISAIGLALIGYIAVFLGVQSRYFPETATITPILGMVENPIMFHCIGIAIFIAIISTADSLLCAIGSNIALDVVRGSVISSQCITAIVGILAVVSSNFCTNIGQLIDLGYGTFCCGFAVPIIAAITLRKHYVLAAMLSVLGGIGTFIVLHCVFSDLEYASGIALLCSFMGYVLGYVAQSMKTSHA